ncbi:hypothetical protein FPSE_04920 [Fusarium pseudograminearum CS3096]|uniref:Uncharacterized protein n=1 Tax=Fusarium pseudograminearum (strain CS3096) TaxID=1028729 RepID=K3VKA0_FUSPC|nr:hypothetical protein FPSE_04920 [Fusarium pseudograminearum CS3096]EKJ74884.1 hypothetical protein FPSE_04920 [Fusarium pseudograminearum CS3096]
MAGFDRGSGGNKERVFSREPVSTSSLQPNGTPSVFLNLPAPGFVFLLKFRSVMVVDVQILKWRVQLLFPSLVSSEFKVFLCRRLTSSSDVLCLPQPNPTCSCSVVFGDIADDGLMIAAFISCGSRLC